MNKILTFSQNELFLQFLLAQELDTLYEIFDEAFDNIETITRYEWFVILYQKIKAHYKIYLYNPHTPSTEGKIGFMIGDYVISIFVLRDEVTCSCKNFIDNKTIRTTLTLLQKT